MMLYARTWARDHDHPRAFARVVLAVSRALENAQKNVTLEIQSATAQGPLGFPRQHGRLFIIGKHNMLDARLQAGGHGHPRAFAHAGLSALHIIDNIHENSC